MSISKSNAVVALIVVVLAGVGVAGYALSGKIAALFGHKAEAEPAAARKYPLPIPIKVDGVVVGLELSKDAIEALQLNPKVVEAAKEPIALPPMIGTINYDNERMFSIKPRFAGEISWIKPFDEVRESIAKDGSSTFKTCQRPMKFGDKVKQGDPMVEFWSQTLGTQKAAFVDAICARELSKGNLDRQQKLYEEGAIPEAVLRQSQRQLQLDNNAMLTAERTLRMWKLTNGEVEEIRDQAKSIIVKKLDRDPVKEVEEWAKVVVKVPTFDKDHLDRELTVLEKNFNNEEIIDPANYATPLFRIADLSRLQIWAHPPEEYLPKLRKRLEAGRGALKWWIRFQSEPPSPKGTDKGVELEVAQISPSLEPNQHTPMMIGYLSNPKGEYLIGQFVTATVMIPPPPDTVSVPTDAINLLEGKEFVFVVKPGTDNEFLIRRISTAECFRKISLVRTKLTAEQERENQQIGPDGYKFEPLQPGDRIVTRGVLELTAALDEARNAQGKSK